MPYEKELTAAREAAAAAGREIMTLYAEFEAIANAPAHISTEADRRSQETILTHLLNVFPNDAFCAEEATPTLQSAKHSGPRLWIVDPIDGTRGFARKNGEFSVMIGFVEDGQVALGAVLEPAKGRCTYAVRGEGCMKADDGQTPSSCQVSNIDEVTKARLVQSRSGRDVLTPEVLPPGEFLSTYSAGIKLALIARGEAELYASTYKGYNAWDVCAGHILVEEAGGKVTTAAGRAIRYTHDGRQKVAGIIASNGLLHEKALSVL